MTVYVLTGYSSGLDDPYVSLSYDEVYQRMADSFHEVLEGIAQTPDEEENTSINSFGATAVIRGDWIEWRITEHELNIPA